MFFQVSLVMMADDSDSDSSDFGIPGAGALSFLPVQQQQHNKNENKDDENKLDLSTDSDSSSSSEPGSLPGGGDSTLSFLPVQRQQQQQQQNIQEDNDSSSESSSFDSNDVPGGSNAISFVPVTNTNTDNNNNNDDNDSDTSSSSSDDDSDDLPGGSNAISFVPVNNNNDNNNNNNDSSSSSSSDDDDDTLPGGGNTLHFLPTNTNTRNNRMRNDDNNNSMSFDSKLEGGHMNMLSYNEDPDSDDQMISYSNNNSNNNNRNKNNNIGVLNRIESGIVDNNIDTNNNNKINHISSYSNDEVNYDDSPSPKPRISLAKTMKTAKNVPKIHRKVRSSTLTETRKKQKENNAVWDLVYMTSSPLVCVADFDVMNGDKNKNTFSNNTYNRNNIDDDDNKKNKIIALELLDVSRETEEFINVLRSADKQLCVVHEIATSGNLIKAMAHKCKILHYSGHGFPSYLAFEDENSIGDTHMLRDTAFKKIVTKSNKLQLKFVFTSACHSESVGQAFVSAGVPHVVSIDTKFEVSDQGAMTFTKYFYEALLCGRTIRDSFNLAKQSVQFISSSAKRDFEKFKLLPKKGKHDVALFKNLNSGKLTNKSIKIPPNNLPTTIQPFIGRSIDMREIIHSFMSKKNENCRILNIYGDQGVGKTSIAIMVCRYLNDRKIYFKNGIFYINIIKLLSNQDATTLTEMINFVINKAFEQYDKMHGGDNNNNEEEQKQFIGDNCDELISNLKLFCRYGLFIIDDIDQLISFYKTNDIDIGRELFSIIFKILCEVSEKIKFIIISKKICNEIYKYNNNSQLSPKTYHLKRLSSTDCANLFSKLTAGQWRANDIKENIDIMSILKNNPLQIHQLAKLKNQWECQTLTKLVDTYNFKNKLERKQGKNLYQNSFLNNNILKQTQRKQNRQQLIKQYITNPSAQQVWRKAHGMEICDYYKIFEILKYDFTEYTFSKRKLEQNNLMECFRILGMNENLTINIEKFDNLYNWFNGLTRLVQILSNYYDKLNPIIIHGFVSRNDAHKMLLDKNKNIPIGTFIIRFRYKEPKSIAISYKKNIENVSNLKCDLSNNNDSTFICGKKLLPLPQFILSFPALKYLYHPKSPIPKNEIFKQQQKQQKQSLQQQPHFDNMAQSAAPTNYNNHHHHNLNNNNSNPGLAYHKSYH